MSKADEFDVKFDQGEGITSALDLTGARHPDTSNAASTLDFATWSIDFLDREARQLGVNDRSVFNVWIAEHHG